MYLCGYGQYLQKMYIKLANQQVNHPTNKSTNQEMKYHHNACKYRYNYQ